MTEPPQEPTTTPDELDPAEPSRAEPNTDNRRHPHGLTPKGRVRRTRAGAAWVALIVVAILIILMLVFIGQNTQKVAVHFLWLDGRFSLGIALLFAAVAGLLIVALPGGVRIIQLRRALRKNEQETHPG